MNKTNIYKLDLNLLKGLSALLSERHVGRAATRMNVTQSGMSHTLARLRAAFDDPLFVRTAKGLEPTSRALELSILLGPILDQIGLMLTPERFDPAKAVSRFRLLTHAFIINVYLSSFFSKIRRQAPGVIFETGIIADKSYEKLDRGDADLIIGRCVGAPESFKQRQILQETVVCLIDKNHPAAKSWGSEAFLRHPHIKYIAMGQPENSYFDAIRQQGLKEPDIGFYGHDLQTFPAILEGTDLIAMIPSSLAELSCHHYPLTTKPCPIEIPNISVRAVWHERNQNDQLHRWLRDQLIVHCQTS